MVGGPSANCALQDASHGRFHAKNSKKDRVSGLS